MQSLSLLASWLQKAKSFDSSQNLLWELCAHIGIGLKLEDCVVYLLNNDRKTLTQKAVFGKKRKDAHTIVRPIEIPLGVGIVGRVAKSKIAEIIVNTAHDPDYVIDDSIRLSEMTIPIIADNQLIGVFDSEHSEPGFYTMEHLEETERILQSVAYQFLYFTQKEELEFMSAFAEQIPIAILRLDSNHKILRHNRNALPLIKHWGNKAGQLSNPSPNVKSPSPGQTGKWIEFTGEKYYLIETVPDKKNNIANIFAFDITGYHDIDNKSSFSKEDLLNLITKHLITTLITEAILDSFQTKENRDIILQGLIDSIQEESKIAQQSVLKSFKLFYELKPINIIQFLSEIIDSFYNLSVLFQTSIKLLTQEKTQNCHLIPYYHLHVTITLVLQRLLLNSGKNEILIKFETEKTEHFIGKLSILNFEINSGANHLISNKSDILLPADFSFVKTILSPFQGDVEIQTATNQTKLIVIKWHLQEA